MIDSTGTGTCRCTSRKLNENRIGIRWKTGKCWRWNTRRWWKKQKVTGKTWFEKIFHLLTFTWRKRWWRKKIHIRVRWYRNQRISGTKWAKENRWIQLSRIKNEHYFIRVSVLARLGLAFTGVVNFLIVAFFFIVPLEHEDRSLTLIWFFSLRIWMIKSRHGAKCGELRRQ